MNASFDPIIRQALMITGQGMLGLFIFMGVFYAILRALMALFPGEDTPRT